jgi:hypothetical protein
MAKEWFGLVLTVAPKIASHFVSAEVRTFDATSRAAALAGEPRRDG